MKKGLLTGIIFLLLINCGNPYKFTNVQQKNNIRCSGARSSAYGIRPFPAPRIWSRGIEEINQNFKGSQAVALWIVGTMANQEGACNLEFPVEKGRYKNITSLNFDKHEKYLAHFDTTGIKVYLQIEPAMADVDTLIKLVLERYRYHPCVIGFGVDGEWHQYSRKNDWGVPIDDESAERWEKLIKSYNQNYQLFLKHWDRRWMPKTYRGDIIFVSDSQMFKNKNHMLQEFIDYWGSYFYPNTVFYQLGYQADIQLWSSFENPVAEWGKSLANGHRQNIGIFWVDFTLKETVPALKNNGDLIIGTKIYTHKGELSQLFTDFEKAHINLLIASEELNKKPEFRQLSAEKNLKRFLIFPVFYDPAYLKDHPEAFAIQKNGDNAKEEWVEFVCPSNQDFRLYKINQLKEMIKACQPDGISIDFIRHFVFWEKIYPDRVPESLPNTCFCENCRKKFQDQMKTEITANSPESFYHWVYSQKQEEWINWKSDLITSMVQELVAAAKEIKPDILINLHIVPWRKADFGNARELVLGQNLKELAKYCDYLSPMTYAHMIGQSPDWISSIVQEMADETECKILPSFQVSRCYREEEIDINLFQQYRHYTLQYPSSGFVYWSWERLSEEQKKIIMR
ncbi:MAG: hypothetical protein JXQ65_08345 [Candidatus Marinimicrobia bacterium]|nr:hypothetical protein [Candidatus Neomarinimicrobiota bacterium]